MNIAVCIFGGGIVDSRLSDKITHLFDLDQIIIFTDSNFDMFSSLYRCALKKRDYEIQHGITFDLCLGIHDRVAYDEIDILKIPDVIEDKRVYYTRGTAYVYPRYFTHVNPDCFFSKSLEFDRIADFIKGAKYMPYPTPESKGAFYFFIKSLMLNTECVNYEDSSLFIWSAQNTQ